MGALPLPVSTSLRLPKHPITLSISRLVVIEISKPTFDANPSTAK